ncbi:MEDS domain-containing protein [Microbacterium sp. APC 3898]|uniref:MEDS domain-containing protein n=2 Tax=Planococcus TaxID=1372 RepID=A0ABT7ZMN7_9BACL|nr:MULTISPECIES: MEDS domain-containing protein [Terrabacteria group]MBF6632764.1 MEDS domain-containing protein [Planococcus sp. (in: firmicutes)]MBD8015993.1 MEDS domain-containing protein [Planococcus wigleyi]MDN3428396.1 MEDS domain-containing protein [Planococcus sp. APC 4016]MDN3438554.1 MEDS domain-containing protein [Planococcus sp. APC 3900]MDN3498897.1 MEDS domain-containing protein [Microbacterium sp. APC 3898]
MKKEIADIQDILKKSEGVHIFYYVEELERYIDNAVSYIVSGIEHGDQVLFVESERLYPIIFKRVKDLVSEEQLKNIHFVNNFTFYWRKGNFHPPTILAYFSDLVSPFMEENLSFRTWGHVEWRDETEIKQKIKEYESAVDQLVPQIKAVSVCAYDAPRVSDSLKEILMNSHKFLMTDDDFSSISINAI